jgi:hypothetical protein
MAIRSPIVTNAKTVLGNQAAAGAGSHARAAKPSAAINRR